jgi:polyhydroxyalkanoate synthesis regulator phasin
MQNPVLHAFFLGRAFAEVLTEKVEDNLTNALSEWGKFDAEQREHLRQFIVEVQARASREVEQSSTMIATMDGLVSSDDLQETLDKLRAEIASLKAELKNYRETIL